MGGIAVGTRSIPIIVPWIGTEEAKATERVILSGWVTQGPEVAAFEREFAEFVGAEHACAVSNCTTALHLALLGVGVGPGDEVITVSHSMIATANTIRYCGAVPVFVDIEPDTFNMDPALIKAAMTERTRAVLVVHQIGMPCDMQAIVSIARQHGLPVIEDAACAIGSEIRWDDAWEMIGKPHGDVACFSFHPRKLVTTGDGGMLTTSRRDLDEQFRLWRQHGMSVPDTVRHGARQVIFESYPVLGYNYRMTDIQAAIGRVQLQRLPEVLTRRRKLAERYLKQLAGVPCLGLPTQPEWARSNWQSFGVRLPDHCDQRTVMQSLLDKGISTRRGIMCAHREATYATEPWACANGREEGHCGCGPDGCTSLKESELAQDNCILLPLYHQMTINDQDYVLAALETACTMS